MGQPTIYKPSIYNGNGIYKNGAGGGGGGGGGGILPSGYNQIEKITVGENNYFLNFNKSGSNSYIYEISGKVQNFGTDNNAILLESRTNDCINIGFKSSSPKVLFVRNAVGSGWTINTTINRDVFLNDFVLNVNQSAVKVNDLYTSNVSFNSDNFTSFSIGRWFNYGFICDIYYLKIYNGANLWLYGIPAKNSLDEKGVFDVVNSIFYKLTKV